MTVTCPPRRRAISNNRTFMPTAPLQDRAVNGALRFLKRQVSDAFYKHYAFMLADTPAPERSDTAQRPRGRLSSPLRAAPRRRSPPSCSSRLFCRNEDFLLTRMYAANGILTNDLLTLSAITARPSHLSDRKSDRRFSAGANSFVGGPSLAQISRFCEIRLLRFSCYLFAPFWIDPIADSLTFPGAGCR